MRNSYNTMNKFYRIIAIFALAMTTAGSLAAQADTAKPVKVAVFIPLYLNEAFAGTSYSFGNQNIPKNVLSGLEFYNGVMMAIDSLNQEGARLQFNIYDTKQTDAALNTLFNGSELLNTGLIIASFTAAEEVKKFADIALSKNIPLISATYPNASVVKANPFFVLLNSSFKTHLLAIDKYLHTSHAGANIIAFRKIGAVGDYMKKTFTDLNNTSTTGQVKFKWVDLPENFSDKNVLMNLDSTKNNIVLVASPIESFGLNLVKTISRFDQYRTTAIGMPTWDGIRELNGKDCRNVEIVFSTPFNYSRTDGFETYVTNKYKSKYYSRPSDMAFRGYETTFHFGKLLLLYKGNLINNLSNSNHRLFNDFDVKPVKLSETSLMPDYLENKKLYFLRKQEGNLKGVT